MTLNTPMYMKHSSCAVQTVQFHLISELYVTSKTICFGETPNTLY